MEELILLLFASYRQSFIESCKTRLFHTKQIRGWGITDGMRIELLKAGLFNPFTHHRVDDNKPTIL